MFYIQFNIQLRIIIKKVYFVIYKIYIYYVTTNKVCNISALNYLYTLTYYYRIRTILQKYMGPQLLLRVGMAIWPYFNPKLPNL